MSAAQQSNEFRLVTDPTNGIIFEVNFAYEAPREDEDAQPGDEETRHLHCMVCAESEEAVRKEVERYIAMINRPDAALRNFRLIGIVPSHVQSLFVGLPDLVQRLAFMAEGGQQAAA